MAERMKTENFCDFMSNKFTEAVNPTDSVQVVTFFDKNAGNLLNQNPVLI